MTKKNFFYCLLKSEGDFKIGATKTSYNYRYESNGIAIWLESTKPVLENAVGESIVDLDGKDRKGCSRNSFLIKLTYSGSWQKEVDKYNRWLAEWRG